MNLLKLISVLHPLIHIPIKTYCRKTLLALLLLARLLTPGLVQAQHADERIRTGLRFGGSLSYISMGEVNKTISPSRGDFHFSIDFRGEACIPLSRVMSVSPGFEIQLAPKFYEILNSYHGDYQVSIWAYNISPGLLFVLTPRLSENSRLELSCGPSFNLAWITIDGEERLDPESGSGAGLRGELAFVRFFGSRESTAARFGVVARYAKVKVGGRWRELDFSGAGLFGSIHIAI